MGGHLCVDERVGMGAGLERLLDKVGSDNELQRCDYIEPNHQVTQFSGRYINCIVCGTLWD